MNISSQKTAIRNRALALGFDACGFSKAERLDQEAIRLEEWLLQGRQGEMSWMEKNFEKRVNPSRLVPGTKTVLSVLASYHFDSLSSNQLITEAPLRVAKYAHGRDYHKVFKKLLKTLFSWIQEEIGEIQGRVFVDSAPVMDKAWAERCGLGWIGKNSNLLNRDYGSWFLLGEILMDLELEPDAPVTDHCGSCTKCIDACPTDAIYEPYRVDGSRCISYLTIELKDKIPEEYRASSGDWIFGCDICQDVCPWNRKASVGQIEDLQPREKISNPDLSFWKSLTYDEYEELFNGTPVRRARFPKLKQNISNAIQNLESAEES